MDQVTLREFDRLCLPHAELTLRKRLALLLIICKA
jgi:hypothetical protein